MSTVTVSTNKRKGSTPIRFNSRKVARIPRQRLPRNTAGFPFPQRQLKTLTYCDSFNITIAAGATVGNVLFRANSIHDPDPTGVSGQPYGLSTFASIYDKYSVKSAVIDINFAEAGSSDAGFIPTMCGVWNNDTTVLVTSHQAIREQPGSVSKMLTNDNSIMVKGVYQRDKMYPAYGQSDSTAAFGANPTEDNFFNIFASRDNANTTDGLSVICFIKITYTAEMWDPKKL